MRELSLDLAEEGVPSTVLIKGVVDKETQDMITSREKIKNIFIPERFFTAVVFLRVICALALSPRKRIAVFLSKEKAYKRIEMLKRIFPQVEPTRVFD